MSVLTLAALSPRRAERIRGILRAWNLPWIEGVPDIPPDRLPDNRLAFGYLYLTIFPCGGLYLGMRAGPFDARYRGSGSSEQFKRAALAPLEKTIVVVLGVFSRKPGLHSLRKMEVHYLRHVGIPLPGEGEPCPPPWLNRWAHNGGPATATPESQAAAGKIGGKISGRKNAESGQLASIRTPEACRKGGKIVGPKTSPRYRDDPEYRAAVDAADPAVWGEWFPNLPINKAASVKAAALSVPKTPFLIEPVSRPSTVNPESRRGRLVALALRCRTSAEYAEGYPAVDALFGGNEANWRSSFSVIWRMGFVRLRYPATGEVIECPQRAPRDALETPQATGPHP